MAFGFRLSLLRRGRTPSPSNYDAPVVERFEFIDEIGEDDIVPVVAGKYTIRAGAAVQKVVTQSANEQVVAAGEPENLPS